MAEQPYHDRYTERERLQRATDQLTQRALSRELAGDPVGATRLIRRADPPGQPRAPCERVGRAQQPRRSGPRPMSVTLQIIARSLRRLGEEQRRIVDQLVAAERRLAGGWPIGELPWREAARVAGSIKRAASSLENLIKEGRER